MLYTDRIFVTYVSPTMYSELKTWEKYEQLNSFCNKLQIFSQDGDKTLLERQRIPD